MIFQVFHTDGISQQGVCQGMTWTDESTHFNIGPCPNPDMNVVGADIKIDTYTGIKINKFLQSQTPLMNDITLEVATIQCGRHHHLLGKLSYQAFISQLKKWVPSHIIFKSGYAPARRVAARHFGKPLGVDILALYEAVTALEQRIPSRLSNVPPPIPLQTFNQQGKRRRQRQKVQEPERPDVFKRAKHDFHDP